MKELNEMTIGRTDDRENLLTPLALEAAKLVGAGSRNPSGPADMMPRRKAEHMIAIDLPVRILTFSLASEGPSTHGGLAGSSTGSSHENGGTPGVLSLFLGGAARPPQTSQHPPPHATTQKPL